jgi:mono/diheme cytochrome c family protein
MRHSTGWAISCHLVLAGVSWAQDPWAAPVAEASKTNPLESTPESVAKGRGLFVRYCAECHGTDGRSEGAAMPEGGNAVDMTQAAWQKGVSDGELFWKIANGRKAEDRTLMPAFAARLSENERWRLIHFLRSLDDKR